jgi:hypothetical protein
LLQSRSISHPSARKMLRQSSSRYSRGWRVTSRKFRTRLIS